jgi:protoheme IX farnesyltransferase
LHDARTPARGYFAGKLLTVLNVLGAMHPRDSATTSVTRTTLIRRIARLFRVRIAVLAALSTATGYLVLRPQFTLGLGVACAGVLLLASGASALNQWQEPDIDARMARTRTRPLPSGLLRPRQALAAACMLVASGALVLSISGARAVGLGLTAVLAYNAVYTPLKRTTALAAVPGGLVGVIPPAIGWTVAGGASDDPRLLALAFFLFVWQVPHFWLLLLCRADEYADAQLPSLAGRLGPRALGRLTFVWMASAALAAPLLSWSGLTHSSWTALALLLAAAWLLYEALPLLRAEATQPPPFRAINVFACAVMSLLIVDALCTSSMPTHVNDTRPPHSQNRRGAPPR